MWKQVRYGLLAACLAALVVGLDAEQRSRSPRARRAAAERAAAEIARHHPRAVAALRLAYRQPVKSPEDGAKVVAATLRAEKLEASFKSGSGEELQFSTVDLSRADGFVATDVSLAASRRAWRMFTSIDRRDEILDEIGVTGGEELEPKRREGEKESELQRHLREKAHLVDDKQVAESFDANAIVRHHKLPASLRLLRLVGGTTPLIGRFYFCCLEQATAAPAAPTQSPFAGWSDARGLAMPQGNLREQLALVTVPKDTDIYIGVVADNTFATAPDVLRAGGGIQIFVPRVESFPVELYTTAAPGSVISEVAVVSDGNRVVRFRPVK